MKELDALYELHKAMNGPYDDSACEHCTYIMRIGRPDAPEDAYIEYPCETIRLIESFWNPLEHPVPRPD